MPRTRVPRHSRAAQLMSERDLRALDMRHTLPNLKNLLLTLTAADTAPLPRRPRRCNCLLLLLRLHRANRLRCRSNSPTLSLTGLASPPPSRPPSPVPALAAASSSSSGVEDAQEDGGSGSGTPKVSTSAATSATPELGAGSRMSFFAFSGFLRARTAQTPSVRAVSEEPEAEAQVRSQTPPAGNGEANGEAGARESDEEEKGAAGAEGAPLVVAPS
jgi:hypothetical protein